MIAGWSEERTDCRQEQEGVWSWSRNLTIWALGCVWLGFGCQEGACQPHHIKWTDNQRTDEWHSLRVEDKEEMEWRTNEEILLMTLRTHAITAIPLMDRIWSLVFRFVNYWSWQQEFPSQSQGCSLRWRRTRWAASYRMHLIKSVISEMKANGSLKFADVLWLWERNSSVTGFEPRIMLTWIVWIIWK